MAMGPGSAPYNTLPDDTTIGLMPGGTHVFGGSVEVADADVGQALSVRLTVTSGWLKLGTEEDPARELTLDGTESEINAALAGLTYLAPTTVNFEEDPGGITDVLEIETSDDADRWDVDQIVFRITSDGTFSNAAPINDVPTATFTVGVDLEEDGVDTVHGFGTSIQVSDPRGIYEGGLRVRLAVDYGELNFAFDPDAPSGSPGGPPAGVDIEFVSGGESSTGDYWELWGEPAQINLALAGLKYSIGFIPEGGTAELKVETFDGELYDTDTIPFNIVHTLTAAPATIEYDETPGDDPFDDGLHNTEGLLHTSVWNPEFMLGDDAPEHAVEPIEGFDQARQGRFGILYLNGGTGDYLYVPDDAAIEGAKDTQTETFQIAAFQGSFGFDGGEESIYLPDATQVLTIKVNGVNDVPMLTSARTGAHYMDSPGDDTFAGQGGTLSSTDRDLDDDPTFGVVGAVASTSRPGFDRAAQGEYGTLYMDSATGTYLYEPDDAAFERLKSEVKDTFTLTVTDESGATVTQPYTATIVGRNDRPLAPVAEPIYAASGDQALAIPAASGILAHATDRDGDPLTAVLLSGPSHGVLALQPDGSFVYTPQAGFSGADSFLVEASDGDLASTPIRVTLHVGAATPLAADDVLAVSEDRSSLERAGTPATSWRTTRWGRALRRGRRS